MNTRFLTSAALFIFVGLSPALTSCFNRESAPLSLGLSRKPGNAEGYEGRSCSEGSCPTFEYTGSGSQWKWILRDDGMFSGNESDSGVVVIGSYLRLPSGFVKLVISESSGPDAPSPDTVRYGLEIPGVAFLVQSLIPGESSIIVAVSAGRCPAGDFTSNWLLTQYPRILFDMTDPATSVFGTLRWNHAESYAEQTARYAVAGDYQSNGPAPDRIEGQCSEGIISSRIGLLPATTYLTDNGAAIVKFFDASAIFALPALPLGSAADLEGDYAGLIFNSNDLLPVRAAQARIDAHGKLRLDALWAIEPLIVDPFYHGTASLDAINSPGPGFVKVTVTTGAGEGKMACTAASNLLETRKNVFFCVGQAPGPHSLNQFSYNVLLVSN